MIDRGRLSLALLLLVTLPAAACGDSSATSEPTTGSTEVGTSTTTTGAPGPTGTGEPGPTTGDTTTGGTSTGGTSTGGTSTGGTSTGETSTGETSTSDASATATSGDTGGAVCPPDDPLPADGWTSALVYPGDDGYLVYVSDGDGNRIPDFGSSGYRRGEAPIPAVATVVEVSPGGGADDTATIQAALDQVGALPPGPDGHRGAVQLAAGTYTIVGTLKLDRSGVVLRGAGDGSDPASNTILEAVGDNPHQRDVIVAGSGLDDRWKPEVPGTRTDVVSELVPVGAHTLDVAEPGNFVVGDHVVIVHPCTAAWLDAVDNGATAGDQPWSVGSQPLVFKRQISAIDGASLTLDAPVFNHLDRTLAQSYVYTADRGKLVTEVGVEDLRIDIATAGGEDENHAWNAIVLRGVEDAWVRGVTALHFGFAGVTVETGVQITVDDVRALDPVAQVTGGRMYNFDVSGAQQVLFTRCQARGGRHHYVSNGTTWTSGVVFHRSTSEENYAPSEGHRRWTMGLLYDNVRELAPTEADMVVLGLYNRGDYGTGHGWASAHSVAWAHDLADGIGIIQRPPTAQNYAIGGSGTFTGATPPAPFKQPEGYIEGTGKPGLHPESLYERQLAERLCGH